MAGLMFALDDATFDEQIRAEPGPVLVDFWANWCGPCKAMEPVLEEIAREHQGHLKIGKVNVDDNFEVVRRFEVMSIPTMILFQSGLPKMRLTGAKSKAWLVQELAKHM
jgi:thioredoxin 1